MWLLSNSMMMLLLIITINFQELACIDCFKSLFPRNKTKHTNPFSPAIFASNPLTMTKQSQVERLLNTISRLQDKISEQQDKISEQQDTIRKQHDRMQDTISKQQDTIRKQQEKIDDLGTCLTEATQAVIFLQGRAKNKKKMKHKEDDDEDDEDDDFAIFSKASTSLVETNDFLQSLESYRNDRQYGWKTFIFNNFNLVKNINVRKSILISINLHYSTLTSSQIDDFLDVIHKNGIISTSPYFKHNYERICEYSKKIQSFFHQIPILYQDNEIEKINGHIEEIFERFIPSLYEYFSHYFEMYSKNKIVFTNKENLRLHGNPISRLLTSRSEEELLFSKELELFYNETDLSINVNQGNEIVEILFENAKIKDLEAMGHNIFGTLVGWICSLQSVAELVGNGDHEEENIKIKYSKFPLDEMMVNNHLKQQINSVFPDIQYSLTSSFYHHKKLSHYHNSDVNFWDVPVPFVRLMAIKILLYARRSTYGDKEWLRLNWNAEHVIKYDPLEIVLRISLTDNLLPLLQFNHLEKLQTKINNDYSKLIHRMKPQKPILKSVSRLRFVENFEDNNQHKDKWLNNVFLLTSMIISELNGTFGVRNHYNYNGSCRIQSTADLFVPKKEFFIEIPLRERNNITQQDIEEMIENGKVKKIINSSQTATDWGQLYKLWMDLELESINNINKK